MNAPKKKRMWLSLLLVLLTVSAIAITMLWSLPARFVYDRYSARVQPLRLQGIEGTLWSGKAAMASYAAKPIGPLQWQLVALPLLRGQAVGEAQLQGPEVQVSSGFRASRTRLELANAKASFPASLMAPALDIPSLVLLGTVEVDMKDVVIDEGLVRSAIGTLTWNEVGVSGSAEARLGKLIVEFAPRVDGFVEGRIRDEGGPLQASGSIELRGLTFNADIKLNARPGNDYIREALLYVGERSADGGSVLRIEGTINRLF